MALGLGRLGLVDDGGRRQPRPDGAGSALLGHTVVADDRVEAAPGAGVLGRVVSVQRGRDTALVLGKRGTESGTAHRPPPTCLATQPPLGGHSRGAGDRTSAGIPSLITLFIVEGDTHSRPEK